MARRYQGGTATATAPGKKLRSPFLSFCVPLALTQLLAWPPVADTSRPLACCSRHGRWVTTPRQALRTTTTWSRKLPNGNFRRRLSPRQCPNMHCPRRSSKRHRLGRRSRPHHRSSNSRLPRGRNNHSRSSKRHRLGRRSRPHHRRAVQSVPALARPRRGRSPAAPNLVRYDMLL